MPSQDLYRERSGLGRNTCSLEIRVKDAQQLAPSQVGYVHRISESVSDNRPVGDDKSGLTGAVIRIGP